ncbi:MAG: AAA family ATPase [Hyphomicrobiaceae bacterium]
MPIVVAFVSQKGGVGKSTLARALAAVVQFTGLAVRIADLDPQQATAMRWGSLRQSQVPATAVDVKGYRTSEAAIADGQSLDLIILDAPCRSDRSTLTIAQHAHLVVQPTGPSLDDLYPAILLFHELVAAGIPKSRLVFAICRTLTAGEEADARAYLEQAGYAVLPGAIAERSAYRAAQNQGRAITETTHKDLNQRADDLITALLARIGDEAKTLQEATQRGTPRSRISK